MTLTPWVSDSIRRYGNVFGVLRGSDLGTFPRCRFRVVRALHVRSIDFPAPQTSARAVGVARAMGGPTEIRGLPDPIFDWHSFQAITVATVRR